VLELAEAEYMVRASGYLKTWTTSAPCRWPARRHAGALGDVATVQVGPEMRRGIAELDGEGEVAGGVVVLRSGKNAQTTIAAVKRQAGRAAGQPAARAWRSSPPTTAAR
jgi:Cu(I)/Ag(I) efflux system membrane protein CusA/SilA